MKNITILQRLMLILLTLSLAFGGVVAAQMLALRDTIFAERQNKLRHQVDSAMAVMAGFEAQAKAGTIDLAQAQRAATTAVRMMRWNGGEYFGVYQQDGTTLVHWNPKYEGIKRWEMTDSHGGKPVQTLINAARSGTGFFATLSPRANSAEEVQKLGFAAVFAPWGWVVQTTVAVDDIDATLWAQVLQIGGAAVLLLALAVGVGVVLGRGLSRPLLALCTTMDQLSDDRAGIVVPFTDRRNEIGRIARGLEVLRLRLEDAAAGRATEESARLAAAETRGCRVPSARQGLARPPWPTPRARPPPTCRQWLRRRRNWAARSARSAGR